MPQKPDYLSLSDDELLRQCKVDRYRASGPGGQKRNKTESAVRLRHLPTGLSVTAVESRSQHENRARALRRLRDKIAFVVRSAVQPEGYAPPAAVSALFAARVSRKSDDWRRGVQGLLDLIVALDCAIGEAARRVGVTTGALSKLLLSDQGLARTINELRVQRGMRPLR